MKEIDAVSAFSDYYKAREEGGKIFLSSPVAEVTIEKKKILGYTKTSLVLQIELSSGLLRLDRYGNIYVMYRR